MYRTYSGFPGGLKTQNLAEVREKNPKRIIEHAVKGMLPGSNLAGNMLKKLHVYEGAEHNHEAQNPQQLITT